VTHANTHHIHRTRCDQCEAAVINGVFCHETGCPNTHSRYDSGAGSWIKQRKCFDCGYTVDVDDPCCSAPVDADGDRATHGAFGWLLVPNTSEHRFPNEHSLACPKCKSTQIELGCHGGCDGRMGSPGTTNYIKCLACGNYASELAQYGAR
jgi:hypothetical protein